MLQIVVLFPYDFHLLSVIEETAYQFEETPTKSNDYQDDDKRKPSAVKRLPFTSDDVSQLSQ